MAFGAKRLRVQLPCGDETHVVEAAADDLARFCPMITSECHDSCLLYATHCLLVQTCHYPTNHPVHHGRVGVPRCLHYTGCGPWSCEWDSCETGTHCYINTDLPVYVAAEGRGRSLVSPDDLPVLRGRLEQRMREVDAFAQKLKDRVQAQLDDLDRAEDALRERYGDEEGKE
ncbi:MAG: hypothetical protein M3340_03205 [Actinomycetota bacterium]|nr:hypothetical protein [Actinomycetota bacterium]